jgi:hypothetical protein
VSPVCSNGAYPVLPGVMLDLLPARVDHGVAKRRQPAHHESRDRPKLGHAGRQSVDEHPSLDIPKQLLPAFARVPAVGSPFDVCKVVDEIPDGDGLPVHDQGMTESSRRRAVAA